MKYTVVFVTLLACFGLSDAGQCCKAYTDIGGTYHSETWCDNYCCNKVITSLSLTCCDNPSFASHDNVDDFCAAWFSAHVWVPIVGTIVVIGIIVGCLTCCCCCGCCCCRRDGGGTVIVQGQQHPTGLTVVSSSNTAQMTSNPYHAGYNQ